MSIHSLFFEFVLALDAACTSQAIPHLAVAAAQVSRSKSCRSSVATTTPCCSPSRMSWFLDRVWDNQPPWPSWLQCTNLFNLIHVSTVFSFCLSSCSSNMIYGLSCIFSSGTWRWWRKSRILFVDLHPFPSNEAGCEYDQVRFTGYKGYMLDDLRLRTTRMAGQPSHVSKHWHEMCTNTRHVRAGSLRLDQISLQLS